ncbi:uncharacterized protein LOC119731541 [Patiria miniata]|uniref:Uncharacterized protein n=1 Tax=Patiria miniata TaxID=46514 RepID=A0A914A9W3_PATMI|nr:uncharacterized protein LOC119731541 [Patiria miniata]
METSSSRSGSRTRHTEKECRVEVDKDSTFAKDVLKHLADPLPYRHLDWERRWKLHAVTQVNDDSAQRRFKDKKLQLERERSNKQSECFAFGLTEWQYEANRICDGDIRYQKLDCPLGRVGQGINACLYPAVLLQWAEEKNFKQPCIIVYKVAKGHGRVVPARSSREIPFSEPSREVDHFISAGMPDSREPTSKQLSKSQIYLFEFDEQSRLRKPPRHCLPYAVVSLTLRELTTSPSPNAGTVPPVRSTGTSRQDTGREKSKHRRRRSDKRERHSTSLGASSKTAVQPRPPPTSSVGETRKQSSSIERFNSSSKNCIAETSDGIDDSSSVAASTTGTSHLELEQPGTSRNESARCLPIGRESTLEQLREETRQREEKLRSLQIERTNNAMLGFGITSEPHQSLPNASQASPPKSTSFAKDTRVVLRAEQYNKPIRKRAVKDGEGSFNLEPTKIRRFNKDSDFIPDGTNSSLNDSTCDLAFTGNSYKVGKASPAELVADPDSEAIENIVPGADKMEMHDIDGDECSWPEPYQQQPYLAQNLNEASNQRNVLVTPLNLNEAHFNISGEPVTYSNINHSPDQTSVVPATWSNVTETGEMNAQPVTWSNFEDLSHVQLSQVNTPSIGTYNVSSCGDDTGVETNTSAFPPTYNYANDFRQKLEQRMTPEAVELVMNDPNFVQDVTAFRNDHYSPAAPLVNMDAPVSPPDEDQRDINEDLIGTEVARYLSLVRQQSAPSSDGKPGNENFQSGVSPDDNQGLELTSQPHPVDPRPALSALGRKIEVNLKRVSWSVDKFTVSESRHLFSFSFSKEGRKTRRDSVKDPKRKDTSTP